MKWPLQHDRAPEPTLFQSDTAIRTSLESTGLNGRDVGPLDRTRRRSGARSARPSAAAADVVIVVDYVDSRLLRGRRTAVDSGASDRVGLVDRMDSTSPSPGPRPRRCPWAAHHRCPARCPAPPRLATGAGTHLPPARRPWTRTSSRPTSARDVGVHGKPAAEGVPVFSLVHVGHPVQVLDK